MAKNISKTNTNKQRKFLHVKKLTRKEKLTNIKNRLLSLMVIYKYDF